MTHVRIRDLDDRARAAGVLHDRSGASVLITWGEHGMFVSGSIVRRPARSAAGSGCARSV
jgi:hypothetical protein